MPIKSRRTSSQNWNDLSKVKAYWKEFKLYRHLAGDLGLAGKINGDNKKYNHHLGTGGYKKAVRKWQKMEQDHKDTDIRTVT